MYIYIYISNVLCHSCEIKFGLKWFDYVSVYSLNTLCIKIMSVQWRAFCIHNDYDIYLISSTFSVCNDFMNNFQRFVRSIYLYPTWMIYYILRWWNSWHAPTGLHRHILAPNSLQATSNPYADWVVLMSHKPNYTTQTSRFSRLTNQIQETAGWRHPERRRVMGILRQSQHFSYD